MLTDHISQNIQVQEILKQSLHELQWGDYSDMEGVDVFEVWTIRADSEIYRAGVHAEYSEAVASARLMVLIIPAGAESPITRSVVVWIFRDDIEGSVLEVGIQKRQGNLVNEKERRLNLIDEALDQCQKELIRLRREERDDGS